MVRPGGRPRAPERERFHFREGRGPDGSEPPNNWTSIFGGPAWTRVTEADGTPGQCYLNLFDSSQADLNWTHPDVAEDFLSTLRFWLDLGVDGFRVDVAFGLAKDMTYADALDPTALETERVRLDSTEPGADLVAFERGHGVVSVTNCAAEARECPVEGRVLLSSQPLVTPGQIPPDTTAWLQT